MSPSVRSRLYVIWSFPRVSGDEPAVNDSAITTILFSPRERG